LFSGSSADAGPSSSHKRLNLDPDALSEEGEATDATNADEEAMMTVMGLAGFGSTKVC
jgi:U4/U6.U5 tri-snRNP-associated protein 3